MLVHDAFETDGKLDVTGAYNILHTPGANQDDLDEARVQPRQQVSSKRMQGMPVF